MKHLDLVARQAHQLQRPLPPPHSSLYNLETKNDDQELDKVPTVTATIPLWTAASKSTKQRISLLQFHHIVVKLGHSLVSQLYDYHMILT